MKFAVIMAGGQGTRLWPLSTPKRPKQFLKLIGDRTMLQETVHRILPLVQWQNIYVVTANQYTALVREQLPQLPPENIIGEPVGRGTAPCIGLAALALAKKDPHGVMAVLPADHAVQNEDHFRQLLAAAFKFAAQGTHLITLGINPRRPATGYGYIQGGEVLTRVDGREILAVKRFTEKPSYERAREFLAQGGYFWNSGMFIFRVDTILEEIRAHLPNLRAGLTELSEHLGRSDYERVLSRVYSAQETVSIDKGVMEKSDRVVVIPTGEIGWSDVGDWAAWAELLPADADGNVVQAPHIGIDTKDSVILSRDAGKKKVATLGVSNLIIIETDDALLVMDKDQAQEVKQLFRITPP